MFDWAGYFSLAQDLSGRPDEAALRSAISRAYYAAFCKARNKLRNMGVQIPQTGAAHQLVWNEYRNDPNQTQQLVGLNGDRLRVKRNQADYNDQFQSLTSEVQTALIQASNVLSNL